MDIERLIRTKLAQGKASGLCVSFDSTDGTYRATATFATIKERDEEIDRLEWLGRNPKIEGAQ